MIAYSHYDFLKPLIRQLIIDVIHLVQSRWKVDWVTETPKLGTHFYYQELIESPNFERVRAELCKLPNVKDKYSEHAIHKPILALIEATLSSVPEPAMLDNVIEYWWPLFCEFLDNNSVPVRLLVGLSNFVADQPEYVLDSETRIRFFGDKSLFDKLPTLAGTWHSLGWHDNVSGLVRANSAVQVDFNMPAIQDTLEYGRYSHECIDRMLPLVDALQLSSFGRIIVGPWIPICNPKLPIDGVQVIGEPKYHPLMGEPKFMLDSQAWIRFQNAYWLVNKLHQEDREGKEEGSAIRRRFQSALWRFSQTFEQGWWESVVVDIVILMESLLTPNKQGGRMQLALAASNLLGITPDEAREIFQNVIRLYKIRNEYVHGEPTTQQKWEEQLSAIAEETGYDTRQQDTDVRAYAIEVVRDYARRTIQATLNLYYGLGRPPSEKLTADLHRLHLDPTLRTSLQSVAQCYSLTRHARIS